MRKFELELTNEEVAALRREIKEFRKEHLVPKLAGEAKNPRDTANAAYEGLRRLLVALAPQAEGGHH